MIMDILLTISVINRKLLKNTSMVMESLILMMLELILIKEITKDEYYFNLIIYYLYIAICMLYLSY